MPGSPLQLDVSEEALGTANFVSQSVRQVDYPMGPIPPCRHITATAYIPWPSIAAAARRATWNAPPTPSYSHAPIHPHPTPSHPSHAKHTSFA